jgi:hypothetical protein
VEAGLLRIENTVEDEVRHAQLNESDGKSRFGV